MNELALKDAVERLVARDGKPEDLAASLASAYDGIDRRCTADALAPCGHAGFVAQCGKALLAVLGASDTPPTWLPHLQAMALELQTLRQRMRAEHRERAPRRTYTDDRCGEFPFRDAAHDALPVAELADTSTVARSGRSYGCEDLMPYVDRSSSPRHRAALYRARLQVRTLRPCDLHGPEEAGLVGQRGVFAMRVIGEGACLGVYGGQLLRGMDWMLLPDDRYLISANDDEPAWIDGETLLSMANTRYLVDTDGRPAGHPDDGYNCEMAGFDATLAQGWRIKLPALFATRDIAPGEELRWNYGTARVRAGG